MLIGSARVFLGGHKSSFNRVRFLGLRLLTDNNKVAVAMSGGIDSSVAAMLLKDMGYDCVGVFMKNWDSAEEAYNPHNESRQPNQAQYSKLKSNKLCSYSEDKRDMLEVCTRLGIPSLEVDFVKEYWNEVFIPFIESYKTGIETPNPDVFCNRFVKFRHFKRYAQEELGASIVATGHYCRTMPRRRGSGEIAAPQLLRGIDFNKDQSYFLSMTMGSDLSNVLFPLGSYRKSDVRALAHQRLKGLHVIDKAESMGICFIGKRPMHHFLGEYIDLTSGRFVDLDTGEILGSHNGLEYYTIGQNARIGGRNRKYYVVGKTAGFAQNYPSKVENKPLEAPLRDVENSDVFVVDHADHPALYRDVIHIPLSDVNWIRGHAPPALLETLVDHASPSNAADDMVQHLSGPPTHLTHDASVDTSTQRGVAAAVVFQCEAQCRYGQPPVSCSIQLLPYDSSYSAHTYRDELVMKITLHKRQKAVTPGQIIAFYDNDECLGGAVIGRS
mmetsp:Transcript_22320/g.37341  ORF Transcript_22320/g.37341 Transcript_22320/m.37341 type:complete len:498 (-) Transcript_22320:4-1497(-)